MLWDVPNMNDEEILRLCAQGEDSRTQFKVAPIGVAKLASELVAFSNSYGGVILFGVNDSGRVVGLSKADAKLLDGELSNAANEIVRPSIYPRTEFHTIRGKLILAVTVPEGISKPYADKSGFFWAKSGPDKRRITSREELQRMLQASLLIHADELPVPKSSFSDIDLYHFGEFLQKSHGISAEDVLERGKVDIPQLLQNLALADGTRLTLGGLLLFGKNPQRFSPVNVVKCVAFDGNDPAGSRYRDSQDFSGTIRDMFRGALQFVMRNLPHRQKRQNFNSIGIPEIPEEAIQEILANMFLHRDYFINAPWRIMMFDSRIEFASPGSLPNHLDVEKIKHGVSIARNPVIFSHATKEIPYRGLGTGIQRALKLVGEIEFINDVEDNMFTVVIPIGNEADRTANEAESASEPVNEPINGVEPVSELVNEPVSEPVKIVLRAIAANPGGRRPQLGRLTGLSLATVKRAIAILVADKRIKFRGAPRNGGYYLIES